MFKISSTLLVFMAIFTLSLAACSPLTSPNDLAGTTWQLVSYGPQGQQIAAAQGVSTWITFDADGRVSGTLGCNQFSGEYKIKGSTIEFGPLLSTLMACPEPQMSQESAAFEVLTGTAGFEISGDQLIIRDSPGLISLVLTRLFEQ